MERDSWMQYLLESYFVNCVVVSCELFINSRSLRIEKIGVGNNWG